MLGCLSSRWLLEVQRFRDIGDFLEAGSREQPGTVSVVEASRPARPEMQEWDEETALRASQARRCSADKP